MEFTPVTKNVEMFGIDEVKQMGIAATGKVFYAFISGLYAKKIESTVRESCANARDGHINRGNTDTPFFVHAPTVWEPYYSVRDFGSSMTHDFVMNLYSTIGYSSKEGSNKEIGTWGFGSKSPFSVTSQFTVTCWQDGEQRVYNCHLDHEGKPSVALMGRAPSDEPQGVMVRFDVKERETGDFQEAIKRIARSHRPCFESNIEVASAKVVRDYETFYLSDETDGPFVEIGCVWYPIDFDVITSTNVDILKKNRGLVLRTPIGALGIIPSRESLEYTERTNKALNDIIDNIHKRTVAQVDIEVAGLTSAWEAVDMLYAACDPRFVDDPLYLWQRGRAQTPWGPLYSLKTMQLPDDMENGEVVNLQIATTTKIGSHSVEKLSVHRGGNRVVFIHDEMKEKPKSIRARMHSFMRQRGIEHGIVVTLPDPIGAARLRSHELRKNETISRAARKRLIETYLKERTEARTNILNFVADYGCPNVVRVDVLGPPVRWSSGETKPIICYKWGRNPRMWKHVWQPTHVPPASDTNAVVVVPLDDRHYKGGSLHEKVPKLLRAMHPNRRGDVQVIGVSRTHYDRFLAENPEFHAIETLFTAGDIDVAAVRQRAIDLHTSNAVHLPSHEGVWNRLEDLAHETGLTRPTIQAFFAASQKAHDRYEAQMAAYRRASSSKGFDIETCRDLYKLATGEDLELPEKEVHNDEEIEAYQDLRMAYPGLTTPMTSAQAYVQTILGTDAMREFFAAKLGEEQIEVDFLVNDVIFDDI